MNAATREDDDALAQAVGKLWPKRSAALRFAALPVAGITALLGWLWWREAGREAPLAERTRSRLARQPHPPYVAPKGVGQTEGGQ